MNVVGKKITVVGLGETAVALSQLLLHLGAKPYVTECDDSPKIRKRKTQLEQQGVWVECGGHSKEAFQDAAIVIPSPGVPPTIPLIHEAVTNGAQLMSELEFASCFCRSKILAVTGTNGKTTTTELLYALVKTGNRSVILAGNNDLPFSAAVLHQPAPEFMVLEVSSYQLELARTFKPFVACVLNVTPDHLGRHKTMEEYARVKAKIFQAQDFGDIAVINIDDTFTRVMTPPPNVEIRKFSIQQQVDKGLWVFENQIYEGNVPVARVQDSPLLGKHNLQNVLAALTMARAIPLSWETLLEGLRAFRGVPHRLEYITTIRGARYFNDSKSTNIDSLRVALESFTEPIILLAGGRGKGAAYDGLRELIKLKTKYLLLFGEDAPIMKTTFEDLVPCEQVKSLEDAVKRALEIALPGDVVLLSPACASFDMFENFEHRGNVFKSCVLDWARKLENET